MKRLAVVVLSILALYAGVNVVAVSRRNAQAIVVTLHVRDDVDGRALAHAIVEQFSKDRGTRTRLGMTDAHGTLRCTVIVGERPLWVWPTRGHIRFDDVYLGIYAADYEPLVIALRHIRPRVTFAHPAFERTVKMSRPQFMRINGGVPGSSARPPSEIRHSPPRCGTRTHPHLHRTA